MSCRLAHEYVLSDQDKTDLRRMQNSTVGQLPWVAAHIARRIAGHRAWDLAFFDLHATRIDLVDELTGIADRARDLFAEQKQLGLAPTGQLRESPDAVDLYMRRAAALDEAIGRLLDRVAAFADDADTVDRIESIRRHRQYLDRLDSPDQLERAVAIEVDRHESLRLQNAAHDSQVLATIGLNTDVPLIVEWPAPRDRPDAGSGHHTAEPDDRSAGR